MAAAAVMRLEPLRSKKRKVQPWPSGRLNNSETVRVVSTPRDWDARILREPSSQLSGGEVR